MKLYRYEFRKDNTHIGILVGLDEFFNTDEILSVCGVFEDNLELPSINMDNTESWFTEHGNRKFRKAIRKIQRIAETKGIEFITRVKIIENYDEILYKDYYQVVILKDWDV